MSLVEVSTHSYYLKQQHYNYVTFNEVPVMTRKTTSKPQQSTHRNPVTLEKSAYIIKATDWWNVHIQCELKDFIPEVCRNFSPMAKKILTKIFHKVLFN